MTSIVQDWADNPTYDPGLNSDEYRDGYFWPGFNLVYSVPAWNDPLHSYWLWLFANDVQIMGFHPGTDPGRINVSPSSYDRHQVGGSVTIHAYITDGQHGPVLAGGDLTFIIPGTPIPPPPQHITDGDQETYLDLFWQAPDGGADGYLVHGGSFVDDTTIVRVDQPTIHGKNVGNVLTVRDNAPGLGRPISYTLRSYKIAPNSWDNTYRTSGVFGGFIHYSGSKVPGDAATFSVSVPDSVGVLLG
jgi:hypothetical protein